MNAMQKHIRTLAALALAIALAGINPLSADEPVVPFSERYLVQPVLDVPLRVPSVCKVPDGTYYLTGTTPRATDKAVPPDQLDWQNNTTIKLWKSKDCQNWEEIGVVFGFRDFHWSPERGHNYNWAINPRPLAGEVDSPRHYLGFTSPKIHYLKDTFWLAFSMNGMGTGLAKSTSGKAEGPYVLWGNGTNQAYITADGADPSMFQDDDGSVYWLWSPAWIAKLKDDLTGLAEAPKLLTCEPRMPMGTDVLVGERGPFLFKANGLYHLTVAALMPRLGINALDTFIATSKTLAGPYSKRILMIPHGGPTTVFQDDKGGWQATFCGRDRYAAFRDRAGIVPLERMKSFRYQFNMKDGVLRTHPNKVYTERGPWHKLLPILDKPGMGIRDMNMIQAPDGYFYFTGSVYGEAYKGKLTIFRSKDLKSWEEIVVRTFADETDMPEKNRNYRTANNVDWNNYYMDCEVHYLPSQKNFFITGYAYVGIPVVLRSTTGKGEGPYELIGRYGAQLGFFEDDDGKVYMHGGVQGLIAVKPDLSEMVQPFLPAPNRALGGVCGKTPVRIWSKCMGSMSI